MSPLQQNTQSIHSTMLAVLSFSKRQTWFDFFVSQGVFKDLVECMFWISRLEELSTESRGKAIPNEVQLSRLPYIDISSQYCRGDASFKTAVVQTTDKWRVAWRSTQGGCHLNDSWKLYWGVRIKTGYHDGINSVDLKMTRCSVLQLFAFA